MKRFSVFLGVVLGGVLLSVVVLGLWPRVYESKTEFAVIAAKDLDKVVPGQRVYPEEPDASIMSTRWSFYRNEEFLVEVLRCYRAQASEHSLSDEEVWKCLITSGCGLESRTNIRSFSVRAPTAQAAAEVANVFVEGVRVTIKERNRRHYESRMGRYFAEVERQRSVCEYVTRQKGGYAEKERQVAEAWLKDLLAKEQEVRKQAAEDEEVVIHVTVAKPPKRPIRPRPWLVLSIGFGLSLVLGGVAAKVKA